MGAMKALTQQELQNFVTTFSSWLAGAQLQEVLANDRGLALGFHGAGHYWLILDLVPQSPMFLMFKDRCPFRKSPKGKPVSLFLNSRAKGLRFSQMTLQEQWGRVVKLELAGQAESCELEIRLIPKQANLIVRAGGKQIAWDKPLELSAPPVVENPPAPRSLEEIQEEWLREQGAPQKNFMDPIAQWEKQRQKDLIKKKKALEEIQKQIESSEDRTWSEVGLALKSLGNLDVPAEYKSYVQRDQSLSWNIEHSFSKAKQLQQKKEGARVRALSLAEEIRKLEQATYKTQPSKTKLVDLMQKADARGRKRVLESGIIAYCGKSAADNLALLRQAKAWDYWLHLKDYPGAHAIIHRQRDQEVSDKEIQAVAEWVAKESLAAKSLMLGQKVAVAFVECRFVRPIKGDKLGRVTYHSERTLSFTLRHS